MTENEKAAIAVNIKTELKDREVFRRVLGSEEGQSVLTWILNECGYFSITKDRIESVQIAFCNRLLNRLGVVHFSNLFEDTRARVGAASDKDLVDYLAKLRNGELDDQEVVNNG